MIYQITAILLLLGFYSVYLGKMVRQRRRNIQTDQMAKGKKERKVFLTELIMKIATYLTVAVELLCILLNASMLGFWPRIVGIILGAMGVTIFATAVFTMKDSWRAGIPKSDKTTIITSGIYRISRNPAFLGFDLVYIGILLLFFNYVLLVVTLWAMVMLHLQILQEEAFLPTVFGEEYVSYKKTVCRYLGRRHEP